MTTELMIGMMFASLCFAGALFSLLTIKTMYLGFRYCTCQGEPRISVETQKKYTDIIVFMIASLFMTVVSRLGIDLVLEFQNETDLSAYISDGTRRTIALFAFSLVFGGKLFSSILQFFLSRSKHKEAEEYEEEKEEFKDLSSEQELKKMLQVIKKRG